MVNTNRTKENSITISIFKAFIKALYSFKEIEDTKLVLKINKSVSLVFRITQRYDTIDLLKVENGSELKVIFNFNPTSTEDWTRLQRSINESSPSKLTVVGDNNKVQHGDGNVMIKNQAKEIEYLQQLLVEKERMIEVLMSIYDKK